MNRLKTISKCYSCDDAFQPPRLELTDEELIDKLNEIINNLNELIDQNNERNGIEEERSDNV